MLSANSSSMRAEPLDCWGLGKPGFHDANKYCSTADGYTTGKNKYIFETLNISPSMICIDAFIRFFFHPSMILIKACFLLIWVSLLISTSAALSLSLSFSLSLPARWEAVCFPHCKQVIKTD